MDDQTEILEIQELLAAPFPPERVHWRIGRKNKDGSRATLLAYLDARDVMDRLDEVLGIEGWQSSFKETQSGRVICELRAFIDGTWITKSDGAGSSAIEGDKGGISDALKRAAVSFGIGRYLYSLDTPWVELDKGKIPKSFDGTRYLPKVGAFKTKVMKTKYYNAIKNASADDDELAARELWNELSTDQQQEMWHMLGPDSGVRSNFKRLLAMTAATDDNQEEKAA